MKLFKDFTKEYNPSSISAEVGKTRVGAYKSLKNLEKNNIVKSKKLGKANFYYLRLGDEYVKKHIELLLMEEARKKQRWIDEFKELCKYVKVVLLFGSVLKKPKTANDIDLLLIMNKDKNKQVNEIIKEKNTILIQKIHPLKQTEKDFIKNFKKNNKVLLTAVKEGIVLHGYEKYVELIKYVSI
ncbi:nucleotidyltransferase domain-containing protein [Candidatus Woesearchaeota archaeon]|nr:nucleotidyltransferase domain-containing protein [Candidatus Woesearchaeota archaeon]